MKTTPVLNLQDIVDSYEDPAVLVSDKYEIVKANLAYFELYNIDAQYHQPGAVKEKYSDNLEFDFVD